jgi:chromosome segregation ATPase
MSIGQKDELERRAERIAELEAEVKSRREWHQRMQDAFDASEAQLREAGDTIRRQGTELAAALEALQGLVARWEVFTSDERGGWGNQHDAYYDLAKHAQKEWAAARQALDQAGPAPEVAEAERRVIEAAVILSNTHTSYDFNNLYQKCKALAAARKAGKEKGDG